MSESEIKKEKQWGGRREGAGRKPLGDQSATSMLSMRVTAGTLRKVRLLREYTRGDEITFNRMFARWVDELARDYGIE